MSHNVSFETFKVFFSAKAPTPRDDIDITGCIVGLRLNNFKNFTAVDSFIESDSQAQVLVDPRNSDSDSNVNELKFIRILKIPQLLTFFEK